jgi:hypothetical protein
LRRRELLWVVVVRGEGRAVPHRLVLVLVLVLVRQRVVEEVLLLLLLRRRLRLVVVAVVRREQRLMLVLVLVEGRVVSMVRPQANAVAAPAAPAAAHGTSAVLLCLLLLLLLEGRMWRQLLRPRAPVRVRARRALRWLRWRLRWWWEGLLPVVEALRGRVVPRLGLPLLLPLLRQQLDERRLRRRRGLPARPARARQRRRLLLVLLLMLVVVRPVVPALAGRRHQHALRLLVLLHVRQGPGRRARVDGWR